jgi:hypothetical protein
LIKELQRVLTLESEMFTFVKKITWPVKNFSTAGLQKVEIGSHGWWGWYRWYLMTKTT